MIIAWILLLKQIVLLMQTGATAKKQFVIAKLFNP